VSSIDLAAQIGEELIRGNLSQNVSNLVESVLCERDLEVL